MAGHLITICRHEESRASTALAQLNPSGNPDFPRCGKTAEKFSMPWKTSRRSRGGRGEPQRAAEGHRGSPQGEDRERFCQLCNHPHRTTTARQVPTSGRVGIALSPYIFFTSGRANRPVQLEYLQLQGTGPLRMLIVQTSAEFVEVAGKRRQPVRVGSSNLGSASISSQSANQATCGFADLSMGISSGQNFTP